MTSADNGAETGIPGLQIIGVLESCFREKFGTPRQSLLVPGSPARLRIYPGYFPVHSLAGLSEFSHVWLISWFHLNTNKVFHPKIHPPRLKGGKIGVFATRSPQRPNGIGLSTVRLLGIEGAVLHVTDLDILDGTPLLDIKPYAPRFDRVENARGGWTEAVDPIAAGVKGRRGWRGGR